MASAADAIEAIADLENAEAELADAAVAVVEGIDGAEGVAEAMEMEKDIEQHMPDAPVTDDIAAEPSADAVMESSNVTDTSATDSLDVTATASNELRAPGEGAASALNAEQAPTVASASIVHDSDMAGASEPEITSVAADAGSSLENTSTPNPSTGATPAGPITVQISSTNVSELVVPSPVDSAAPLAQSAPATPATAESNAQDPAKNQNSFPPGVSEQSMTVRNNPDLILAWRSGVFCMLGKLHLTRQDPTAPKPLYALFDAAVSSSEVSEARAWFELLSESSPTSVRLSNIVYELTSEDGTFTADDQSGARTQRLDARRSIIRQSFAGSSSRTGSLSGSRSME